MWAGLVYYVLFGWALALVGKLLSKKKNEISWKWVFLAGIIGGIGLFFIEWVLTLYGIDLGIRPR
ncbi:hypothetical protein NSQ26_09735 [Bacillus sp. FSL W7-1360]